MSDPKANTNSIDKEEFEKDILKQETSQNVKTTDEDQAEAHEKEVSKMADVQNIENDQLQLETSSVNTSRKDEKTKSTDHKEKKPNQSKEKKNVTLHKCDKCKYTSNRNTNITRHVKTMHTALKKPVECCDLIFETKHELTVHKKQVHEDGYYKCKICLQQFNRRALLKRHGIVHVKKNEYKCSNCHYKNDNPSNMKRHCIKKHHFCAHKTVIRIMENHTTENEDERSTPSAVTKTAPDFRPLKKIKLELPVSKKSDEKKMKTNRKPTLANILKSKRIAIAFSKSSSTTSKSKNTNRKMQQNRQKDESELARPSTSTSFPTVVTSKPRARGHQKMKPKQQKDESEFARPSTSTSSAKATASQKKSSQSTAVSNSSHQTRSKKSNFPTSEDFKLSIHGLIPIEVSDKEVQKPIDFYAKYGLVYTGELHPTLPRPPVPPIRFIEVRKDSEDKNTHKSICR